MKIFIQKQLAKKARKLIEKYNPIIIGVTGSVGKTSTRDAIATVLSAKFDVAPNIKNYNNEFGLPLTILGKLSPGRSIFGWLSILFSSVKKMPQVFVLEYAIDHPGDMNVLCQTAKPSIAVLTRISPVHAEFFRSVEQLAEEKAKLIECVPENGLVVLNADDPLVLGLAGHASAKVLTYGFSPIANVHAVDYSLWTREDFSFEPGELFSKLSFGVETNEKSRLNVEVKNMLGKASASSLIAAIAIARHLGLSDEEIISTLPKTKHEPGRMNPIPGIKGSLILDSSYNAAPASMHSALEVLGEFYPAENSRRIAVLGYMAELGQYSEQEHRIIGMKTQEVGVDFLVTVGEIARDIRRGAIEAGLREDQTQHFSDSVEAGRFLDSQIKKGDIVLVKGSQSARMEKAVKDIMAEPTRAEELLVRQDWKN
ncbi:UDP-N-acetylmuramoyl-tripeptide--D-alanyl-D-alanine ligase [Candidatus Uhrbacteria bacterium]|nr:UDP-N-acetylmuramoyl-tripeptide--D-alanyl-D-alanine ligase [Candidatus Uhrbacteria bacterium]